MAGGYNANTRQNMRYNLQKACPTTGAGPVEFQIPQVGLLARLMATVYGTIKVTHASLTTITVAPLGPWTMIQRIRLFANGGITFVDLSGADLYLENLTRTFGSLIDSYSANDPSTFQIGNVSSAGGTTNSVAFTYVIPIALNDRDTIGLFLLQNPTTQVTLRFDVADPTTAGTLYTNIAGYTIANQAFTIALSMEYFSIPPDPADFPPINTVVATTSQKISIPSSGYTDYQALLGNVWSKVLWYFCTDATLTPLAYGYLTDMQLVYNQAEVPYYLRPETIRRDMRDMYGRNFPQSVYALDFNHQGIPQLGNSRDLVNTGAITDLRLRANINGGTPIDWYVIVQQLISLSEK